MKKVNWKHYRVPKKIKIGGFIYDVVFPHVFKETNTFMGLHCAEDLKIFITPYIGVNNDFLTSRAKVHECLLHEIIHGIDSIYLDDDMQHGDIYLLSNTLHQVLHDNDLNIKNTRKPLPKKIKILGMEYDIMLWDFEEVENNCSANEDGCLLKISRDITNVSYQRSLLVFGIVALVYAKLKLFDEEVSKRSTENNRDFRAFSRGLYQVIIDNDLEKVMRNG